MDITLSTNLLTEESLRMLDQVSSFTKKDFSLIFQYIESLKGIEKRVFIKLFKEENTKLHDLYIKKFTELRSKNYEEYHQRVVEQNKRYEEALKNFSDEWNFSKVEEVLTQSNPSLCGVLIRNDIYYKELSIKESIPYIFVGFDTPYNITLPFILKEIKNISFERAYQTYNSYCDISECFYLCSCEESRKQLIENLLDRIINIKNVHKKEGFLCAYDISKRS